MLYDPKWDKAQKSKPNPPSLGSFIAWLEKQPPHTRYDWWSCKKCVAAQYRNAIGDKYHFLFELLGGRSNYHAIAGTEPYTFGAALARAREIAARR